MQKCFYLLRVILIEHCVRTFMQHVIRMAVTNTAITYSWHYKDTRMWQCTINKYRCIMASWS